MSRPAGQGGAGADAQTQADAPPYCAVCGRPADSAIRRGREAFCSEGHAEEFAREVAALKAGGVAQR